MVDFKQMPPVDPARRIERLKHLTKLQNGAKFEFIEWRLAFDGRTPFIYGRYLDYTGEWVVHSWDQRGRVQDRKFAEMDIDWTSHEA